MGCGEDYLRKSPFGHVVLWHPSSDECSEVVFWVRKLEANRRLRRFFSNSICSEEKTSLTSLPVLGEVNYLT